MGVYDLGMVCALASGSLFLIAATLFGLPVSTTHTIVGAVLGMTIVATHVLCIKWLWPGLMKIVASWFISPVLAGVLSVLLHMLIKKTVLDTLTPLRRAYIALPILTGSTVLVLTMLILYQQSQLPLWETAAISFGVGAGVWGLVHFGALGRVKRRIEESTIEMNSLKYENIDDALKNSKDGDGVLEEEEEKLAEEENGSGAAKENEESAILKAESEEMNLLMSGSALEQAKAYRVFMYLQIFTATLKSFAHGANDVANAAGPFAAVQGMYFGQDPCSISATIWVLILCGIGVILGLSISGHHVIKTIGRGLTELDFPTGFSIELGSTLSVVLASCVGMPVSSTHCQVGSVICIGMYENGVKHVKWGMLNKIIVSWVVTVPIAAAVAGGFLWLALLIMSKV